MPISIKRTESRASTPDTHTARVNESPAVASSVDTLSGGQTGNGFARTLSRRSLSEGLRDVTIAQPTSPQNLSFTARGHIPDASLKLSNATGLDANDSTSPSEQLSTPPDNAAPFLDSRFEFVSEENALQKSSQLLDDGHATQAVHLLESLYQAHPEVEGKYAFHTRYAQAALGHVETLNTQKLLGSFSLEAIATHSGIEFSNFSAERLDCYLAVCKSNSRVLALLSNAHERAQFIEKNSEDILDVCLDGIRHGLGHAILEIKTLINKVCQCNSNVAMASFVERQIARGSLRESDSIVKSFREVQADPLYSALVEAGRKINSMIDAHNLEGATPVWQKWAGEEFQRVLELPEVVAALNDAPASVREVFSSNR